MKTYNNETGLINDLYQINMAFGYWKQGKKEQRAVFSMSFRENPFNGGYIVFSGLEPLVEMLNRFSFNNEDIQYLASLTDIHNNRIYPQEFLQFLSQFHINCSLHSVQEGTIVFPHEVVLRVEGTLIECQLLETLILNIINYSSLISTKASRIYKAAKGKPILEFGLRRSHGINGGLLATRAAYIGGCNATSNLLAGKIYDIPVRGTMSHSWVMSFENEELAFRSYAETFPHNCVFLVDTYDSLKGTKNAIKCATQLPDPQKQFLGVRIDSGDLNFISKKIRIMLDEANYTQAKIFASNNLDENIISSLHEQGAKIDVWAVGTNLITASGTSALNGVYKLSALWKDNCWQDTLKISDDIHKNSIPGVLQIRRFYKNSMPLADAIYDVNSPPQDWYIIHPINYYKQNKISLTSYQDLLVPVLQDGQQIYSFSSIHDTQKKYIANINSFDESIRRFINPHSYPAGIEKNLYQRRENLIAPLKKNNG